MNESKATRYQRLRRRAAVSGAISAGLVLGGVALSPVSGWMRDLALASTGGAGTGGHPLGASSIFVLFLVLLWEVAAFPAVAYAALRVDRAYRGVPATLVEVASTHVKASAVVLPAAVLAAGVVVVSVDFAGARWWLWTGLALVLALAAAVHAGPALLGRLARVRPLSRPQIADTLEDVAKRVRVPIAGVDEWVLAEGDLATALVAGLGRRRRVLVSSELVRTWADDEIAVVVMHELAHHAHRDLWRALALNAAVIYAGLIASDRALRMIGPRVGLNGPGDLAALPLLALVTLLVWVVATPLRYVQSRRQERRADVFALVMTGGADPFRRAIRRLSAEHLAEERPSRLTKWLFHRHPSVAERLALADAYSRVKRA